MREGVDQQELFEAKIHQGTASSTIERLQRQEIRIPVNTESNRIKYKRMIQALDFFLISIGAMFCLVFYLAVFYDL